MVFERIELVFGLFYNWKWLVFDNRVKIRKYNLSWKDLGLNLDFIIYYVIFGKLFNL